MLGGLARVDKSDNGEAAGRWRCSMEKARVSAAGIGLSFSGFAMPVRQVGASLACWVMFLRLLLRWFSYAHVRRKFVDVFTFQGRAIAKDAIRRIAELYAVEKRTGALMRRFQVVKKLSRNYLKV